MHLCTWIRLLAGNAYVVSEECGQEKWKAVSRMTRLLPNRTIMFVGQWPFLGWASHAATQRGIAWGQQRANTPCTLHKNTADWNGFLLQRCFKSTTYPWPSMFLLRHPLTDCSSLLRPSITLLLHASLPSDIFPHPLALLSLPHLIVPLSHLTTIEFQALSPPIPPDPPFWNAIPWHSQYGLFPPSKSISLNRLTWLEPSFMGWWLTFSKVIESPKYGERKDHTSSLWSVV